MAPHLSAEMRNNIVRWSLLHQKSATEIATLAACSSATVYRVLKLFADSGEATNPNIHRGRRRVLSTEDVNFIESLLSDNPALFLDELALELYTIRDVDVSLATLSRTLHRLGLSHKQIAARAAEQNDLLRATWMAQYGDIPMSYFVWLDESSVDDLTNARTHGWAPLGSACVRRATFIRGQRFSVLPALTVDGIIAMDIFEGSVNKERFINFVNEEIVRKSNRLSS